jgi:hypothetical protein
MTDRTVSALPRTTKTLVLARDAAGQPVAVGPVLTGKGLEELTGQVTAAGFTVTGTVPLYSKATFTDAVAGLQPDTTPVPAVHGHAGR